MSAVSLLAGILVDRVPVRYMLAGALVLQAISLVMAPLLSGVAMAFAYGIVLGATSGLSMTARGVIWASFFGRKHLGAITGTVGLIMVAGSALGPMPLGIARDLLGSYRGVLFVSAVFPVAIALLALTMRRPTKGEGAPHTRTS